MPQYLTPLTVVDSPLLPNSANPTPIFDVASIYSKHSTKANAGCITVQRIDRAIKHKTNPKLHIGVIDGWYVVLKNRAVHSDDLVVFFKTGTYIPYTDELMFLSAYTVMHNGKKVFHIKSKLIDGVRSDGYVVYAHYFDKNLKEGDDLSDKFGAYREIEEQEPDQFEQREYIKGKLPDFIPKIPIVNMMQIIPVYKPMSAETVNFEPVIDGLDFIAYAKGEEYGICGKNNEYIKDKDNVYSLYWSAVERFRPFGFRNRIPLLANIDYAIYGTATGPAINGNPFNLSTVHAYISDIYDITNKRFFSRLDLEAMYHAYFDNIEIMPLDVFELVPRLSPMHYLGRAGGCAEHIRYLRYLKKQDFRFPKFEKYYMRVGGGNSTRVNVLI